MLILAENCLNGGEVEDGVFECVYSDGFFSDDFDFCFELGRDVDGSRGYEFVVNLNCGGFDLVFDSKSLDNAVCFL